MDISIDVCYHIYLNDEQETCYELDERAPLGLTCPWAVENSPLQTVHDGETHQRGLVGERLIRRKA